MSDVSTALCATYLPDTGHGFAHYSACFPSFPLQCPTGDDLLNRIFILQPRVLVDTA